MEFTENLGQTVSSKTVTIKRLSKDMDNGEPSYVVLGTPQLELSEVYELLGVLKHEIRHRAAEAVKKRRSNQKKGVQHENNVKDSSNQDDSGCMG